MVACGAAHQVGHYVVHEELAVEGAVHGLLVLRDGSDAVPHGEAIHCLKPSCNYAGDTKDLGSGGRDGGGV